MEERTNKSKMKKVRPDSRPYEVWMVGNWKYEVLKYYTATAEGPYTRAFCKVHGFATEKGDVYCKEFRSGDLIATNYDN